MLRSNFYHWPTIWGANGQNWGGGGGGGGRGGGEPKHSLPLRLKFFWGEGGDSATLSLIQYGYFLFCLVFQFAFLMIKIIDRHYTTALLCGSIRLDVVRKLHQWRNDDPGAPATSEGDTKSAY